MAQNRTAAELEAHLDHVRAAPAEAGTVALIVARPGVGEREVLAVGELSLGDGLVGDTWRSRPSRSSADGGPDPRGQVTVMNVRAIAVIAPDGDRWPLAGDQLYLDLDLSTDNLPTGSRLVIGEAVLEVTDKPHNGCAKFADRFGPEAVAWVNSPEGRRLRLRGINTTVVAPGTVRPGDAVTVVREPSAS